MYLIILCNFKYHKNKNLQNENYELNLEQFIVFLLLSKLYIIWFVDNV